MQSLFNLSIFIEFYRVFIEASLQKKTSKNFYKPNRQYQSTEGS